MLGFACLAIGCKREQISVYTVPKELPAHVAEANQDETVPGAEVIHYKTPSGWTEEAAGGMRVAAFSIPDQKGKQIDVSVVPLPQIRASKADVANLWRQQLGLAPLTDDELSRDSQSVTIGGVEAELFDIGSEKPTIEGKDKARVVVAMLPHSQRTWFFKMSGEDEAVRAQKSAFLEFLNSVEFRAGHPDAAPGRFTSTNVKRVPGSSPEGLPGSGARPDWQVPSGWEEVPPPQMLLAKFVMPDKEQPKAEVTVSVFPGDAGGVLQNVNRWRRQIKLDPVQPESLEKMTTSLDLAEGKAILVDLTGENPTNGQPTRIIGAILPKGDRTWFYKLMGQEQIAEREKAAFIKFVQTAAHPNG
ncbi:MAG TPA: hypothetical protein VJ063_11565 [Verrucomicrobiae bacterium]|nr:hypothetical protein [Verrucomicrobiae bacterium]